MIVKVTIENRPDGGVSGQVWTSDGTNGGWATPTALPTFVTNEVPAGVIDGANVAFTLAVAPSPASSLALYKNGLRMKAGAVDFTLAGLNIQFVVAPPLNSILLADYRY